MNSFARATGQLWKVHVRQILTVAAVAMTLGFFSLWLGNPLHLPLGLTVASYFTICGVWFFWYAAAIRCPKCGRSPAWHQMTHGSAGDWQARLATTSACPVCGFDPSKVNTTGSGGPPAV